ncbi:MAG: hypothetical protein ACAI34_01560 [Verrucomicrobium sp.]
MQRTLDGRFRHTCFTGHLAPEERAQPVILDTGGRAFGFGEESERGRLAMLSCCHCPFEGLERAGRVVKNSSM